MFLYFLFFLSIFFYFVALITFSINLSNVFFYLGALIYFSKNKFDVFFLLNVFFTALPH